MNTTAPQVSNNLVWAILTTLFCCLPLGIVSIVY
ncbi:CD225/dispanin family protein, partial [Xanthomonas sacchari]